MRERDPGKPFLTYYDDATGERVELSFATFDNWAAKTANLLVDGLGVGPGDVVRIALPPHWQTVVVTFAVWLVGASVGDEGAVAAFVHEPLLGTVSAPEVVGMSLDSFGRPLASVRPGVTDFADEIAAYGDAFGGEMPAVPTDFGPADRILLTGDDPNWLDTVRAAYAGAAGVVLVRNPDPAARQRRIETERITRTPG